MLVRGGRRHHEPHYGAVSVCVEGTAPAGAWIRRRMRRATGRRRVGKRRIKLSLNEIFFFRSAQQAAWTIFFFWDGGEGEPIVIECQREQVRRSGPRAANAMRRPRRTTVGGWHTETHDPHAHHHHEGSDRFFFRVLKRGSSTTCYLRH